MQLRPRAIGLALALAAVAAPAAAADSVKVYPLPSPAPAQSRPVAVEFLMTGGDWMKQLRWHSWGGSSATATGTYYTMVCKPSCAGGHATATRGRLVLSGLVRCGAVRLYTQARAEKRAGGRWVRARNLGQPQNPCS